MAKKFSSFCLLLLFLGCQHQTATANPFIIAKQIFNMGKELYEDYHKIKNIFIKLTGQEDVKETVSQGEIKILNKIDTVTDSIHNLKKDLSIKFSTLDNKLTTKTNELYMHINKTEVMYQQYKDYLSNISIWDEDTLDLFYTDATSPSGLSMTIHRIHELLTATDIENDSIFSFLTKKLNTNLMCIRSQSPQQLIYDLYQTAVLADSKALMVQLFAYELRENLKNKTLTHEKRRAIKKFLERTDKLFYPVSEAMEKASRDVWRCDPATPKKASAELSWEVQDATYAEVEAFQAILKFEKDFHGGAYTCVDDCVGPTIHDPVRYEDATEEFNKLPRHKQCKGRLTQCVTLDYSNYFNVCLSDNASGRRYDYIKSKYNDDDYGKVQKKCKGETYEARGWLWSASNCHQCLCTCQAAPNSGTRYFSLSKVVSDVKRRMVVTGVRIRLLGTIYYLQIQQGRLMANGSIDPATVEWMEIEQYNPDSDKLYEVNWEQRTIYLDDLDSKDSDKFLIVTGVRFKKMGNALKLMVERTETNYTTGEFIDKRPYWQANIINSESRPPLELEEADNPLFVKDNHIPDSKSGQYVQFQTTDVRKDVGQATIPFIDLQPIVTNPPMPLSGVGLMHKGAKGSGGYLALKLIHCDYRQYMEISKPKE